MYFYYVNGVVNRKLRRYIIYIYHIRNISFRSLVYWDVNNAPSTQLRTILRSIIEFYQVLNPWKQNVSFYKKMSDVSVNGQTFHVLNIFSYSGRSLSPLSDGRRNLSTSWAPLWAALLRWCMLPNTRRMWTE